MIPINQDLPVNGEWIRMKIRSAAPDDAKRLLEIYGYYVANTAVSLEYDVPTEADFRSRIQNTLQKYPYLVLEEDGIIQGYAYAGMFKSRAAYSRSCEVSIYVDRSAKRRGYGRKLYETLEDSLKRQGIVNMYACIAYPVVEDEYLTRDSERFHRRLGFSTVAEFHQCACKFGRWYNMICMEKIIGEHV